MLVQLDQAETLRAFNNNNPGHGHVQAHFNHGCGHQNLDPALAKFFHNPGLRFRFQAPVQKFHRAARRHQGAYDPPQFLGRFQGRAVFVLVPALAKACFNLGRHHVSLGAGRHLGRQTAVTFPEGLVGRDQYGFNFGPPGQAPFKRADIQIAVQG